MGYAQAKQLDPELIPVVDISDLRTGVNGKAVARQLHRASQTLGFIYIKGHGIPDELIEQARSHFGKVDILVNNAALNYYVPIVDYAVNRWIRAFAVNVHGPFILSKVVLRWGMSSFQDHHYLCRI